MVTKEERLNNRKIIQAYYSDINRLKEKYDLFMKAIYCYRSTYWELDEGSGMVPRPMNKLAKKEMSILFAWLTHIAGKESFNDIQERFIANLYDGSFSANYFLKQYTLGEIKSMDEWVLGLISSNARIEGKIIQKDEIDGAYSVNEFILECLLEFAYYFANLGDISVDVIKSITAFEKKQREFIYNSRLKACESKD